MDGYSFRNMIAIVKSETDRASMILSNDLVEITFLNTSKTAVHVINLNPKEFMTYHYNIRDAEDNVLNVCSIAFDTNELYDTTKGIGKKDGICLYWLIGENKMNVRPLKQSAKDPGRISASFVKIIILEPMRYTVSTDNEDPNVKVQAKEFADVCNQTNTSKCHHLQIVGSKSGVTFNCIRANGSIVHFNQFSAHSNVASPRSLASNIDEIDSMLGNLNTLGTSRISNIGTLNIVPSQELMTVNVPLSTVKALSKIHNISPSGTLLKFYFSEGKPTVIESPIGTYGLYTIGIKGIQ